MQDLRTGGVRVPGSGLRVATASTVKVDVLAALLLRARPLSPAEREAAARMIQSSDNDAATVLWTELGGAPALARALEELGLRETVPDRAWGKTMTTAADRVRLLRALVSSDSPLPEERRAYALALMSQVRPDQRWGVSAAAGPGEEVALKNGWMPRDAEGGAWTVNSFGRVTGPDRDVLIAAVSRGHRTLSEGIAAVEDAVRNAKARGEARLPHGL
ncbi:serine hydrolase [Spirillospora sp. NPDC050679]